MRFRKITQKRYRKQAEFLLRSENPRASKALWWALDPGLSELTSFMNSTSLHRQTFKTSQKTSKKVGQLDKKRCKSIAALDIFYSVGVGIAGGWGLVLWMDRGW